jgi:hypothetical protein
MNAHGPGCLPGPITRDPDWWSVPAGSDSLTNVEDVSIRQALVDRVRREIAAGTYDTPEKLDAALEELLRRLEGSGGV